MQVIIMCHIHYHHPQIIKNPFHCIDQQLIWMQSKKLTTDTVDVVNEVWLRFLILQRLEIQLYARPVLSSEACSPCKIKIKCNLAMWQTRNLSTPQCTCHSKTICNLRSDITVLDYRWYSNTGIPIHEAGKGQVHRITDCKPSASSNRYYEARPWIKFKCT